MGAVLHFVYDQSSIWSKGTEGLLQEVEQLEGLACELHCVASSLEPGRLYQDAEAYLEHLERRPSSGANSAAQKSDMSAVFEAPPLIAAVLAAQSLDTSKGLDMLRAVQTGLDDHGLHIADVEKLCAIAAEIGLDPQAFATAYASFDLNEHVETTRQLMARCAVNGREALILQLDEQCIVVPHRQFVGASADFREWLRERLDARSKSEQ